MNKTTVIVPREVRYISDWKNFTDYLTLPCILDKKVTGCGFTEWAIKCDIPIILCSPRKILLENKESQHPSEVFYVKNDIEAIVDFDKNIEKPKKAPTARSLFPPPLDEKIVAEHISILRNDIKNYYELCRVNNKPCKYLVTYDSFRHVKEVLSELEVIDKFLVIIDEFQSIFTDSKFKSSTEIEFLGHIISISNLMYVSATPMIEEYLDQIEEFKHLPYYELDWVKENSQRLIKPQLTLHKLHHISIQAKAFEIISDYREGKFERKYYTDNGERRYIESKEAVFYVNSVKNICDIITKAKLTPEECNILCANTNKNYERVKKAFKLKKAEAEKKLKIGVVPKRGEPHKMFTFCTRTVYLGADFYSTNAKTYIFSDANIDCLAVDITLDLPQIMGRQRLSENPWKNFADLYFKTAGTEITREEFDNILAAKNNDSKNLLSAFNKLNDSEKATLIHRYDYIARAENYRCDYIAVNHHMGPTPIPVFNNLVLLSEIRAFEIQQIDYKDRFSLFNAISKGNDVLGSSQKITRILEQFNRETTFINKMRVLVTSGLDDKEFNYLFNYIPILYSNYIILLGCRKIASLGYQKTKLDYYLENGKSMASNYRYKCKYEYKYVPKTYVAVNEVYNTFVVGESYSTPDIKKKLSNLYSLNKLSQTAKASDLAEYFNITPCKIKNEEGKWENGFKILSLK